MIGGFFVYGIEIFFRSNLAEALNALEADNDFLKRGSIFIDELLEQWIKVKSEEFNAISTIPYSFEYKMYFN